MSTFDVWVAFRQLEEADLSIDAQLDSLKPVVEYLASRDKLLGKWFLKGDSLEDALRYQAFASRVNGDEAARAVLRQQDKKKKRFYPSRISLWNGEQESALGASLSLMYSDTPAVDTLEVALNNKPGENRLGDWRGVAELIGLCVAQWSPLYAHAYGATKYTPKAAFKDRLAVGWMLYLPRVLTPSQVPEARALVPMNNREGEAGTLIVSTTDTFDVDNAEHIQNANAIEVRLADQGLLPSYHDVS